MKNTIIIVLLFCSITLHAQQLGITLGLTTSNFSQSAPFTKVGYGVTSTLFYEKELPLKNCSYSVGLGYTQIRGNGTVNYYNLVNDVVLSYNKMQVLHYAQIPVLFKYQFVNHAKHKLGFVAGLQYDFLLAAWHNPQRVNVNHDVTNQFVRNMLGYQTGLFYSKPLPNNKQLLLNLCYQGNLTSIQKNSNAGFGAFTLGLGYTLGK
jgi:hypothetical protein